MFLSLLRVRNLRCRDDTVASQRVRRDNVLFFREWVTELSVRRGRAASLRKNASARLRQGDVDDHPPHSPCHHTIIFLKFLAARSSTPIPIDSNTSAFPHNSNKPAP